MTAKDEDYFFWIGFCLYIIQATEETLAEVLTITLPKHGIITVKSLEADTEEHRRKTLGQLVRKLLKRARIDPGIEKQLDSFLSQRNLFVHSLQQCYSFDTSEGRQAAIAFCQELATDAYQLWLTLSGVLFATFGALDAITKGTVHIDWNSLPLKLSKSLKDIACAYPAIIRNKKFNEEG
jgi:hypothetical protein